MEHKVICANSIEALKDIPSNSVDLILSDIPYGIGLDDWDVLHNNTNSALGGNSPAQKKAGSIFNKRGKPINGWSKADRQIPKEYQNWCDTWTSEWVRVLKEGGSAMVFAGRRYGHRCTTSLEDAGFCLKDILGWTRPNAMYRAQRLSIVFDRRGDEELAGKWEGWRVGNLRPVFEPIIWAFKPYKKTIADNVEQNLLGAYNHDALINRLNSINNIFECGMAKNEGGYHPAQKPVELMKILIELVTVEGQVVLDPFAGSGATVVAAKELGRASIAIDAKEAYCEVIRERLDAIK